MGQKRTMDKAAKAGIVLIFSVFYGYLLLQFSRVFIYYDDYGYLSLSYGYVIDEVAGTDYNFFQLLEYMVHHYFCCNGRLLYTFFYQLLYLVGGLRLLQAFMAAAILAVAALSYVMVIKTCECETTISRMILASFICLLYGFIGIQTKRHGIYWFAASFPYVLPAISILSLGWMYSETIGVKKSKRWWLGCMALAFVGAFSQEQWLVAEIAMILAVIGYKYYLLSTRVINKEECCPGLWDFAVLAAAVTGALPILTSPKAGVRMANGYSFREGSFWEIIIYNIKAVTRLFFSSTNHNFIFLLLVMLILMTLSMIRKRQGRQEIHVWFIAASMTVGVYLFAEAHVWHLGEETPYGPTAVWLLFGYILWLSAELLYFLFSNGNIFQGIICIAGFFSMACLTIVPELPERVLIPYILLSFPLFGYIFQEIFLEKGKSQILGGVFLICTAVISISNMRNIYRGYNANWKVHQYNDAMLRENARRIKQGEQIEEIYLYQMVDRFCTKEMPYDPGFEFITFWVREYYDLPHSVALIYEPVGDMQDLTIQ